MLLDLCCVTLTTSWVLVAPLIKTTRAGPASSNIKSAFKYRTWLSEDHMEHCGADLYQRGPPGHVFETYTRKLRPVILDKSRGASARPLQPRALRMVRRLFGALRWPASHAMLPLGCRVSLLHIEVVHRMASSVDGANKALSTSHIQC